jgi:hypothetical protein
LKLNGSIAKEAELFGGDLILNGVVKGASKITAGSIAIGESAKFHENITYWSEDGEVDFGNSLISTTANFDETLMGDRETFSWKGFGIAAIGFWVFYLFSAFLVIVLLNWAFGNFFTAATDNFDKNFLKSIGYGLIYLFGLPLLIAITFVTLIGIPVGLFIGGFYLFSLIFGHLVTALLISQYLNNRSDKSWNFFTVSLLALGIAATIRLLTFIPFLGSLLSILVIAIGYGLVAYTLLQKRAALKFRS